GSALAAPASRQAAASATRRDEVRIGSAPPRLEGSELNVEALGDAWQRSARRGDAVGEIPTRAWSRRSGPAQVQRADQRAGRSGREEARVVESREDLVGLA